MNRYLKLACSIAPSQNDVRRYRLGAVGVRRDGTIVTSRNISTREPNGAAHAEARLCRKLDYGSVVYVSRLDRAGRPTMARPCVKCETAMRNKGVKKVYFTVGVREWGVYTAVTNLRSSRLYPDKIHINYWRDSR